MYSQEFVKIERLELLNAAQRMKNERRRLAQICVTAKGALTFIYTFERDYSYVNLTFEAEPGDPVASVGWLFPYAFIYENEIKDLYGVNITDMNMDYKGHFYKTAVKTPFAGGTDTRKATEGGEK